MSISSLSYSKLEISGRHLSSISGIGTLDFKVISGSSLSLIKLVAFIGKMGTIFCGMIIYSILIISINAVTSFLPTVLLVNIPIV